MKVVINKCYGGFSLSSKAIQRIAELQGRECFFFKSGLDEKYEPITVEQAGKEFYSTTFDIPNPNDFEDKTALWKDHYLTGRPEDRSDPLLIKVVEEMGAGHRTGASGYYAKLQIIEIPDGICWEIDEYDGMESISEVHRSWG